MQITINTPRVRDFFEQINDQAWRCKSNGFIVGHGILGFYRAFGGDALCGLTYLGLPRSSETGIAGKPGVVYQRFERGVVAWDQARVLDSPPGAGSAYLMHIESGYGQDPRVGQFAIENVDLKKQLEAGQVIPQNVLDGILAIHGNAQKLKEDAGL